MQFSEFTVIHQNITSHITDRSYLKAEKGQQQ